MTAEQEPRTTRADSVENVTRHFGGEACAYEECSNPAEYDVTMRKNQHDATFPACHGCAVDNGVRPGDYDL